ncbi:MAG TPA: 3-dehydroquinate synthase II [Candidatus Methanomethylophilaceae archaeon]|nr:3-dehydroquinate synthase II [Candidatus Methanomethylophilaceae archaeon]
MKKEIWVRADIPASKEERKEILINAIESGITNVIVRPEDKDFASLGNINLINIGEDVRHIEINSPKDQERAMEMAGKCSVMIISSEDWTIIPLENIITKFAGTVTRVFSMASDPESARLYLKTMEKGVDGIVISVSDPAEIREFTELIMESFEVELSEIEVLGTRNIEMGDRVCVDTVSMMSPGEGMLIGSQSNCLFLVQSESEDSGYVASRPFRVNAGAVHAYIMVPEGRTRYLGELKSGEPIALVRRGGDTKVSSVGRCKIEVRPLILVEATDGKRKFTTILQNAETVKLVTKDGAISVTELKAGDKVLAKIEEGGRHFGMKVEETYTEI